MIHAIDAASVLRFTERRYFILHIHIVSFLILIGFIWSPGLLCATDLGTVDALSVSPQTLTQVKSRLQSSGYSEDDINKVVQTLEEAAQLGIPPHSLLGRVQEGVAKRVPAARLTAALHSDIEYLEQARRVFNQLQGGSVRLADTARWQRAANMLAAGFGPEELAALGRMCISVPEEFRPLSVLYASLVHWGLPAGTTLSVAEALVESPLPADEYEALTNLYRSARRYRISPEELSTRIIAEANRAATIEELERRILR